MFKLKNKTKKINAIILLLAFIFLLTACAQKDLSKNNSSKSNMSISKNNKIHHPQDKAKKILKKMNLDQKIGQLYFIHSTGDFQQMKRLIKKDHLGGITLFGPDFKGRTHAQFLREMDTYQKESLTGMFIATDQEGGTVSRINTNPLVSHSNFSSPQTIYAKSGLTGIANEDARVSRILKNNKINMNFAPVADVALNKNSFIYQRTLGKGYNQTARYIPVAVHAIQKENVAAVLKHFPGYGDAGDTHTGFAQINKKFSAYEEEDLLPFKAGIHAHVDGIMVSHIIIKDLDPLYPASLSTTAHQLLRKKLDYQGLIITDDLQMGAITEFAKKHQINADILALKAGNDLLLGGDPETGIPAIKEAVEKKEISTKQIDKSVYRILKLKEKLRILK